MPHEPFCCTHASTTHRRNILLKAPRSRVWRAVSNAEEFGDWFGVALKRKTFAAGKRVQAQITYLGTNTLFGTC